MKFATVRLLLFGLVFCAAQALAAQPPPAKSLLDVGYGQMYDLRFSDAHQTFATYEREHADDPMGPVSDAAAYLFSEFDRLHVLESELFVNDDAFESRNKLVPDASVKTSFDSALLRGTKLADTLLAKDPRNTSALFAKVLVSGLTADYTALIEKKDYKALSFVKDGRTQAEKLLAIDPNYYDAYIAIGVENYLLSQKPAPVRWFLHMTGAQTDKQTGIAKLELTAANGHYLKPYARLLLAVAALRDHQDVKARELLRDLSAQYPDNHLYMRELAKLKPPAQGQTTNNYGSQ
jgi:hypothetical protein